MNEPTPTPADDGTDEQQATPATPVVTPAVTTPAAPVGNPATGADPAPGVEFPTGYDDRGVPTLDHVRDKIESRYATSLGSTELAEDSAAGRSIAEQEVDRAKAAKERLEQIRRSMGS